MFKYPDPPFEPTKDNLKSDVGIAWRQETGFSEPIRVGVKNTRYTMQYAKQPATVARYAVKLGMDPKELIKFGHLYLRSKPWLVAWKQARWEAVYRAREARTAFGRRRRLLGDRYQVEKEGLNHEVQGTVADMMKMTMVALAGIGCRMVLQRHDGWASSVPLDWAEMTTYKEIVEREWIIDGRPITFPAEYDEISA
jgi:DNA polymerase I-like protein with 3'-5' exonuclease and polymerase domains